MRPYKLGTQPWDRAGTLAREAKQFATGVFADLCQSGEKAKSRMMEAGKEAAHLVKQTAKETATRSRSDLSAQLSQCGEALVNAAETLQEGGQTKALVRRVGRMCRRHPFLLFGAAFLTGAVTRHLLPAGMDRTRRA